MEDGLASAQLAATVLLNLSVAVVLGAGMAGAWLRAEASPWARRQCAQLRVVALCATSAAVVAHGAVLWLEAATMAEVPLAQAAPAVRTVLAATHYGMAWIIGLVALAVVAVATGFERQMPAATVVRLLALAVFLYSRSMVSHAGAAGGFGWSLAADWVHLVLASTWLGEVAVAGLVTLRRPAGGPDRLDQARYIQALSDSAAIAVAGIFATGAFNAWRGLGTLENATGNPYATALLVKIALVLAAAMLGGFNRFFVMPALLSQLRSTTGLHGAGMPLRTFARVLQVEALVLFAVLVVAAVLGATPPPAAGPA